MSITTGSARPSYLNHLIIGLAAGMIAPFTAFAWPFAVLTGIVIGSAQVDAAHGAQGGGSLAAIRLLGVTGGVLAMLFFGAILGGLIAFLIVALFALSERAAADTSPIDRMVVRILAIIVSVATWAFVVLVLRIQLQITIGGAGG